MHLVGLPAGIARNPNVETTGAIAALPAQHFL
jgi:hypothetical protein